jgi:LysM repeat protein
MRARDTRRLLAASLLSVVVMTLSGWRSAAGQPLPAAPLQPAETLEYRLHKGESLADIARVFHLSPEVLAHANGITDPTRLQIAQPLKIPNVFARQVAQLQEERDGLAADKAQLVRQVAAQEEVLAAKDEQLQHHQTERATMARELARVGYWQGGVYLLAGLFLGTLGWGVRLRYDRDRQRQRLALLAHENAALGVAREKYRQAVAHLELRYQKLTTAPGVSATVITEGRALLSRTFTEGCACLEELLMTLQAEREKGAARRPAEQPRFAALLHSLGKLLHR